jgi:proteasome inhibitor subunit 1 (PI31)
MLPVGWNSDDFVYSLIYQTSSGSSSDNYLLKVIIMDGTLLVHLLRMADEKMVDLEIKTEEFVTDNLTSFESAYKNPDQLASLFISNVLDAFTSKPSSTTTKSSADSERIRSSQTTDPLRVPPCRRPQARPEWEPQRNPFPIGRGDLDPLCGGVGGGMFYDPLRSGGPPSFGGGGGFGSIDPSGFPRGSFVPGARFDPVRPPGVDPSGNFRPYSPGNRGFGLDPDPDHLPPPGYDDMFM